MTTALEKIGRRLYFRGAPYEVRGALEAASAKWDPDQRAWWIGSGKAAEAERLVARINATTQAAAETERTEGIALDARVIRGRATYEGKTYYLLARGISSRTDKPYAKLAFRDGSRVFWARDPRAVRIIKEYREPTSIESLRAYAERRQAEQSGERECPLCARFCTCGTSFCAHHHDGCERCGEER
jgi:hypothetical protein